MYLNILLIITIIHGLLPKIRYFIFTKIWGGGGKCLAYLSLQAKTIKDLSQLCAFISPILGSRTMFKSSKPSYELQATYAMSIAHEVL
jgi:hypothetical protein